MQLKIVARNIDLSPSLRALVERRLRFALGRFGTRLKHVVVCLRDLNGPRGGLGDQYRIFEYDLADALIDVIENDHIAEVAREARQPGIVPRVRIGHVVHA